jgi:hypothetical protein
MKDWQYWMIVSAVYIAPIPPYGVNFAVGAFALVVSIILLFTE